MIYRFGDYRIDTVGFELTRVSRPLPVEPQVLELLIVLLDNRDRMVSRDELLRLVWRGRVVSETTLSSRVKSARQVIGDDGTRQLFIKTIHGRGFRFVGKVETEAGPQRITDRVSPESAQDRPLTRYARSGDIHIAYHLFGDGPVNLVLTPGFVSNIDNYWDSPNVSRWLRRLGSLARVAMFDKRGTGLSDRVAALPDMDERMDDVRAVMDAAGFRSAYLMGISEGGSLAALFAVHHPSRCDGLILYGSFAQFKYWFPDEASLQRLFDYIERDWGSGKSLPQFAPAMAHDPAFQRWWGQFERLGATPGAAIALMRMNSRIDISGVLAGIRVPTLVIHVANDVLIDVQAGRDLAARIPGAHYVELPGTDHLPWGENAERIIDAVAPFLERTDWGPRARRVVATLLRVLPRQSDEAWDVDTLAAVQREMHRFQAGRLWQEAGGIAASFDGPARALACALALTRLTGSAATACRMGVHTGEMGLDAEPPDGIAPGIALDVARHAAAGEILVSRTVNDLVAGSGVALEDCGKFVLPSIGQRWRLFRVLGERGGQEPA